jgi:hypothetical protein
MKNFTPEKSHGTLYSVVQAWGALFSPVDKFYNGIITANPYGKIDG